MRNSISYALFGLLVGMFAWPVSSQDLSSAEMRSLDEQVQEIKSDVLAIAADLNRLEERLLYPSGTQVAVFVSIPEGERFRLDAVRLHIDGQLATHYIYSFKELDALQKGGVQRLYTGNVTTGTHELSITIDGETASGREFTHSDSYSFTKGVEPALLGLTVAGPETIRIENW